MARTDKRKKKKSVKGRKKGRKFWYSKPSKEEVNRWSKESGGMYDQLIGDNFTVFAPKEDDFRVRVLPPTFGDRKRFGQEAYIHYSIGADRQKYLCPQKMGQGDCPICEERDKANKARESEYASKLTPRRRFACWIIDRDDEDAGPLVWLMPQTVEKAINKLRQDRHSKGVIDIVNPDKGYDIAFTKEGTALNTTYTAMKIARDKSPIFDDPNALEEVLDFIEENPITDAFNFFDYEHIDNVFAGGTGLDEDDDDDDDENEEDDKRKKKRKKQSKKKDKKKSKKKTRRQEKEKEDDDEDDDEDEEEEEEEEEDSDEDDEDDDDNDDDDDEEDDDDDGDEDEDGDDDSDDDDEDDDDEEDEDETPRRRKKKKDKGKNKNSKDVKKKIDRMRKKKKKRK